MNAPYPHPLLAREGWPYAGALLVLALAAAWWLGPWWSLPLWAALVFVLQFFRDPARPVPGAESDAVCPADGRVVMVGPSRDPYLDRPAIKVSIFMNVFNVHSNRSPVRGSVEKVWYHPGSFLNAALDKASEENERNAIWIRTPAGEDVTCVQVAGLIARRILCYARQGDRLERGGRYGFIRFGSRVDVYLDPGAAVRVGLGQKVYASATILASLARHG